MDSSPVLSPFLLHLDLDSDSRLLNLDLDLDFGRFVIKSTFNFHCAVALFFSEEQHRTLRDYVVLGDQLDELCNFSGSLPHVYLY